MSCFMFCRGTSSEIKRPPFLLGMEDAMLELLPNAAVCHIGMYRLKGSTLPVQYYNRLPKDKVADVAFVLDPLIASAM